MRGIMSKNDPSVRKHWFALKKNDPALTENKLIFWPIKSLINNYMTVTCVIVGGPFY